VSINVPFDVVATFMGRKPAGSGTRNGEAFDWGSKPQFGVPQPDGSVSLWDVREKDLDDAVSDSSFEQAHLKPLDRVRLRGSAFIPPRGSDQGGFIRVTAVDAVDARTGQIGTPKAA
jgi:hypothetical protein